MNRYQEAARRVVDQAPPLTEDQRQKLRALLVQDQKEAETDAA